MSDLPPSVQTYFESLSSFDRERYLSSFTVDAVVRDPYGSPELFGPEGLNEFFDRFERTWSQFNMAPGHAYPAGNRVAVAWSVSAVSHKGSAASFAGVNVFALAEDGSIEKLDGYWDFKAMLAQLNR